VAQTRPKLRILETPLPRDALAEAVDAFLQRGQARNLSPRTLSFYRERLAVFGRWLESEKLALAPADISAAVIRDFLSAERERTSAATAGHAFTTLRAWFRWLAAEEWIPENPMAKVEKVRIPRKLIQALSQEQVTALLAGCGRGFTGARLRAAILVLVDCGLRASELCGLKVEDVDWNAGTLRVMGKGARERLVPFGEAARMALLAYIARRGNIPGQQVLFLTCNADPLNRGELHRLLSEAGKRAGLTGVRCSPHVFRHTSALMFLRAGGDPFSLQAILGHSDLTMTKRYCGISAADVLAKHRAASPGDQFLAAVRSHGGRRRLR
jgi:site-specific recombinase XerD